MNDIDSISVPAVKPVVDITMIIGFIVLIFISVRYVVNTLPEIKNISSGEVNPSTSWVSIEQKLNTNIQAFNQ